MAASTSRRERLIANNRQEYGDRYGDLRFLSAPEAEQAAARRQELLSALSDQVVTGFGGTKLDCRNLSPGCRVCGEGGWSCLFINGRCNLRCFYCPTSQEEVGLPTTNTVEFRTPADYVAYLERFGFTGASISGGEPFLTFPRSLSFVAAIKKRFGAAMHVWLYTNGTLVDGEKLRRLRDGGLDEIRFDIGATAYRLDHLRLAVGTIPIVTVEIPAIAEDLELLKGKMAEMRDAGVNHLNLHQLRLTPYNFPKLLPRGYRYLHGERVTLLGSPEAFARQAEIFREKGTGSDLWVADSSRERLVFSPLLWPLVDWSEFRLLLSYAACRQLPGVSYRNPFVTVKVNDSKQIIIERAKAVGDIELSGDDAALFASFFLATEPPPADLPEGPLAELAGFEKMTEGLQDYF
jgi:pyruvate-formate lyase-activating enzyme